MGFQWTGGEGRFQADVDDMLQDFRARDVAGLARAVDRGDIPFCDCAYADRVARELRARAEEGLLFRPASTLAPAAVAPLADELIPW